MEIIIVKIKENPDCHDCPEKEYHVKAYRARGKGEHGYYGQCVELSSAISQGDTMESFKENIKDAITLILESISCD